MNDTNEKKDKDEVKRTGNKYFEVVLFDGIIGEQTVNMCLSEQTTAPIKNHMTVQILEGGSGTEM